MPAHTLPSGNVLWRVRTYSTDGAVGPWSDVATIIVKAAPLVPNLTIAEISPRPLMRWQAADQQAFQINVMGQYDSGLMFGTQKEYKIPIYLQDGDHALRVRVQNAFGLWSEWTSVPITIANVGAGSVYANADTHNNAVTLNWNFSGEGQPWFYVYRNGKLIGKTRDNTYTDYLSVGSNAYELSR